VLYSAVMVAVHMSAAEIRIENLLRMSYLLVVAGNYLVAD
jgi:hypothetical protein